MMLVSMSIRNLNCVPPSIYRSTCAVIPPDKGWRMKRSKWLSIRRRQRGFREMEIVHAGAYFDFDMTIQWNSNQRKLMALLLPFLAWRWMDAYQPLELKPDMVDCDLARGIGKGQSCTSLGQQSKRNHIWCRRYNRSVQARGIGKTAQARRIHTVCGWKLTPAQGMGLCLPTIHWQLVQEAAIAKLEQKEQLEHMAKRSLQVLDDVWSNHVRWSLLQMNGAVSLTKIEELPLFSSLPAVKSLEISSCPAPKMTVSLQSLQHLSLTRDVSIRGVQRRAAQESATSIRRWCCVLFHGKVKARRRLSHRRRKSWFFSRPSSTALCCPQQISTSPWEQVSSPLRSMWSSSFP